MKNQIVTLGIVLSRNDFQEADRLLTIITPDHGKIKTIAKGVRRPNSKLAGGIELFSVSNITFLPGRGDFATLISTRLLTHYGNIVKDIQRTMLGYELLKRLNRATEENTTQEYFDLLQKTLAGLDDLELSPELTELWFVMQLLKYGGHTPNLRTDTAGNKLDISANYLFDFDSMSFDVQEGGPYTANHIKLLRLAYGTEEPSVLKQVKDTDQFTDKTLQLALNLLRRQIRT
jgi:DNA repair protein RecO